LLGDEDLHVVAQLRLFGLAEVFVVGHVLAQVAQPPLGERPGEDALAPPVLQPVEDHGFAQAVAGPAARRGGAYCQYTGGAARPAAGLLDWRWTRPGAGKGVRRAGRAGAG